MYFKDFIYDDISLSSLGLQIVSFNGAQDDDITTDSQREFNSIVLFGGKYQPFITSTYEDRLEVEFSIGKNYCGNDGSLYFSIDEIERIQYWLNRPTPHKFRIVGDPEYATVYWEGSFNLQWIKAGEETVGLNVTFISNRPYALGNENLYEQTLGGKDNFMVVIDSSADEGSIVPNIIIEIQENGDLELTNTFNNKPIVTQIKNCTSGEIINFSNMLQVITNKSSHNIYNDFNWVFPRIYNVFGNVDNIFTSNISCKCTLSYNPIRKVTFS